MSVKTKSLYGIANQSYKPKKWKGVVLTNNGKKVKKLYFSRFTKEACTHEPIHLTQPFLVILQTQFRSYNKENTSGVAWASWKSSKKQSFDKRIFHSSYGYRHGITYRKLMKFLTKAKEPKQINKINLSNPNEKTKTIITSLETGNDHYFKKELPINGVYSWEDKRYLSMLAILVTQKRGKHCRTQLIEHLRKIGFADFHNVLKAQQDSALLKYKLYQCAPMAKYIYRHFPEKRKTIANELNNSIVQSTKFLSALDDSEKQSYLDRLKVFEFIYNHILQSCSRGKKNQCVQAEFLKNNLITFNKVKNALTEQKQKKKLSQKILKWFQQFESREQKTKNHEISI